MLIRCLTLRSFQCCQALTFVLALYLLANATLENCLCIDCPSLAKDIMLILLVSRWASP